MSTTNLKEQELQELKNTMRFRTEELEGKTLTLYLQSEFFVLTGNWDWDLHSDAVFCSDVIFSFPSAFTGVKGILHPDDVNVVKDALDQSHIFHLSFRIITTYGEVKSISGHNIKKAGIKDQPDHLGDQLIRMAAGESEQKKELDYLRQVTEIYEKLEKFTGNGIWWYNDATNQTWYSSEVYRIFDLAPQSLNAHLDTFTRFIHPEDHDIVTEYIDKSHRERTALHLQYRIVTLVAEKYIQYTSQWIFNSKGEAILSGIMQDVTERKEQELQLETAKETAEFFKNQLLFDEQNKSMAHWHVNLLTRKTVYSDNYYRLFGLKPGSVPAGITGFVNYLVPEYRDVFTSAYKKMMQDHVPPDLEFPIVRIDGKTRFLSQKAKLVNYGDDLVMMGTLQDITVQKIQERKIKEFAEAESIRNFVHNQAEEMAIMGSWVWNIGTGKVKWSENFYRLLGFKRSQVELTQNELLKVIHPDDHKLFTDELALVIQQRQETSFVFRMIPRGRTRNVRASFRIMKNEGEQFFIGTIQDITIEFNLQQQLNQRVQLAEALSENIVDRVIVTDINNNIVVWNRQCENDFRLKKEEAIGRNFFDVFPRRKYEEELQLFNRVLKGESLSRQGKNSSLGNGYYDLHLFPLWSEERLEVNGVILVVHDVTKETELRQNLNDRLSFIENLVESSVDRIIAIDKNLNYLVWNKKCEEYYGMSKQQVIGKNVLEIFPEMQQPPTYEQFRRVLKGETIHIAPAAVPGASEVENHHEVYLIPVKNNENETVAILWIIHDLTKEYKTENELRKAMASLELQNQIYEHAEDIANLGTWTWDPETDESKYSDKMFALFGMAPGEILPSLKTIPPFIHPGDKERILQMAADLKKGGEPIGSEFRVIRKDGEERIFINRLKLIRTESGKRIFVGTTKDVTERKKYEEEIQKNIAILKYTEYLAQTGSWEYDISTGQFIWSDGMYRMFGIADDYPLQPEIYIDQAVEEDKTIGNRIAASLKKNFDPFEEIIRIRKGESTRLIRVKGSVIDDEKGSPQKMIGVDVDITDITVAQEKIKEHENMLSQTAIASPDSITIYDLEQKQPVYLNNCLSEWTGFSNNDLVNMGYKGRLNLILKDDRKKVEAFNEQMLSARDGEVKTIEYRLNSTKGLFVIRNRSKVFRKNEQGKPTHILSVLQDITQEAKLRQQLEDRTRYAESIIDASIYRVAVYDRELRVIAWNERAEIATGVKKEQVIGQKLFDVFPRLSADEGLAKDLKTAFEGHYVVVPPRKASYSEGVYEQFYVPLKNPDNETYAVLNILHDVTYLAHKEEELTELNRTLGQKNKELEQKHEEITHFSFVASHDLKEPLRKLHTFSDWLFLHEAPNLSSAGKNYIGRMKAAVTRMEQLIEDILVLTKITADTQKDGDVDLSAVLRKVLADMNEDIRSTKTIITTTGLGIIKGNENQCFYLFKNLISNAIKFQKPGNHPRIKIASSLVDGRELKADSEKRFLKISFADNGFGFDTKYADKIFQVFQRLHGKDEFGGTGIGLAICKKILDNHGGLITVHSREGEGSVFTCYFPME